LDKQNITDLEFIGEEAMDVFEAIKNRRSIRSYKTDPIDDKVMARLLAAMRLAPSGKNLQPWKFIIVRDPKIKEELVPACRNQTFIAKAPCIIAACAFEKQSYDKMGSYMSSWAIDVTIAMDHLTLAAASIGLGTCWIGAFNEGEVKKILDVPADVRIVALMPLGYPEFIPPQRSRKSLAEIICYEKYS